MSLTIDSSDDLAIEKLALPTELVAPEKALVTQLAPLTVQKSAVDSHFESKVVTIRQVAPLVLALTAANFLNVCSIPSPKFSIYSYCVDSLYSMRSYTSTRNDQGFRYSSRTSRVGCICIRADSRFIPSAFRKIGGCLWQEDFVSRGLFLGYCDGAWDSFFSG